MAIINIMVLSLWVCFVTNFHFIFIKAYVIFMASSSSYFSKMKCWSVVFCFLKLWKCLRCHGFMIRCQLESVWCNRQGLDKITQEYVNCPLKFGRTLHFKVSCLETERYMPTVSTLGNWQQKRYDVPIKIVSECEQYGGSCQPNRLNCVNTYQHACKYVSNIDNSALYTILNYLENSGKLESSLVKFVQSLWPTARKTWKLDIFNTPVKTVKLLPQRQ